MLRATVKSLLSRKLRLLLSGLAVVLGVMAVAGALILSATLTNSFDTLFKTTTQNLDVQVTGKPNVKIGEVEGESLPEPIPADLEKTLKDKVPDAKKVEGGVVVDGARVVKKDGKVLTSNGAPRLGLNWSGESDLFNLTSGQGPTSDDEVAINKGLAEDVEVKAGDKIQVLTLESAKTFTVAGIFELSGGRPSLGGESYVAFTLPVAQKLMLGEKDVFSSIDFEAKDGVSQGDLKKQVETALGDERGEYDVKTGKQVADDSAEGLQAVIGIFRNILLGFAAVALFVGIFLILNTFSIIVAQRTKELALFRAMGASRKQVIGSVLIEAFVIGLIASTAGFGAGIGVAVLLKNLMESQNGSDLPGGLAIPASAVIASYLVGIIVTIIAAVMPAIRASRIPPVAAMREASSIQKPLKVLTIAGAIVTLLGVLGVALSLFGDASIWFLLLGVLLTFIGVAMLTPAIAKPVIDVVGRVFSWSLPGKLGRRNSARNPRRTAITAAALMIGLALVTGVTVVADSFKSSLTQIVDRDIGAQIFIAGDFGGGVPPTYDPAVVDEVRKLPDVKAASAFWFDTIRFKGDNTSAAAADWAQMKEMFEVKAKDGEFRKLESGEVMLDDKKADKDGVKVGDTITVTTQRGGDLDLKVVGIYDQTQIMSGLLMSEDDAKENFRSPQANQGYVQTVNDDVVAKVQKEVDALLVDNPEVSAQNKKELLDQSNKQIDGLLTMLYVLLGLAVVIAILGIVNTLALSILERTRELGLLRAVGLTRAQTMRMVTVESIVISVFGALLGLAVGSSLGAAIVKALKDEGIEVLSFPWGRLFFFLVLAVLVGLFAAILPSIRAARTNVLKAISYE